MASLEDLTELETRAVADVAAAASVEAVDAISTAALGQSSPIAEARRALRDADPEERRDL